MTTELLPLSDIVPYEKNPKEHPQKQVERIAYSLKKFGWMQPLVVDEKNVLVVGHGRLLAAQSLGMVEAPVVRAAGFTPTEIRELRMIDNKLNESEWNRENLKEELEFLVVEGIAVREMGFEVNTAIEVELPEEEEESETFRVAVEFADKKDAKRFLLQMREKGLNATMK